jgi:transposase
LVQTSGRTIGQVADDLGIGKSTLGKWLTRHREADLLGGPHEDTAKELARLRKENEILRAERDLLKNGRGFGPPVRGRNGPCYIVPQRGSRPFAY